MTGRQDEAERLAVAYAPARLRARFAALLAFDAMLRRIALAAQEPLPAQLKLAWWRDACGRLPEGGGHPVLAALAAQWCAGGDALVALVDAWEEVAVAEGGGFVTAAGTLADARGAALAVCAGAGVEPSRDAARVWTMVAMAPHASSEGDRAAMRAAAARVPRPRLGRDLRTLAVLEGLARRALVANRAALIGDRLSPLAAIRLGIFGR